MTTKLPKQQFSVPRCRCKIAGCKINCNIFKTYTPSLSDILQTSHPLPNMSRIPTMRHPPTPTQQPDLDFIQGDQARAHKTSSLTKKNERAPGPMGEDVPTISNESSPAETQTLPDEQGEVTEMQAVLPQGQGIMTVVAYK